MKKHGLKREDFKFPINGGYTREGGDLDYEKQIVPVWKFLSKKLGEHVSFYVSKHYIAGALEKNLEEPKKYGFRCHSGPF